jgi:hypothetical protein
MAATRLIGLVLTPRLKRALQLAVAGVLDNRINAAVDVEVKQSAGGWVARKGRYYGQVLRAVG